MSTTSPAGRDFRRLRESGMRAGSTRSIGMGFVAARDALARGLIRLGAKPNHITFAGFVASCGAAACFVMGAGHHPPWAATVLGAARSYWPWGAAACLILAGACDILDGAVARIGNLGTTFGGLLDSTLDRLSEMVIFLGIAVHFALAGNVTYVTLAFLAMCHAQLISYVKARAEEEIPDCGVGFWQRGERCVPILLGTLAYLAPVVLWQQATLPFFTFLRRVLYARAVLRAQETGRAPPPIIPGRTWVNFLRPWRFPRGTIPYDVAVLLGLGMLPVLAWLSPLFRAESDPLGNWLPAFTCPLSSSAP